MAASRDSERYNRQRDKAVRAAASVFAEKGYHGASTSAIAQQLGIKQGSLYYYFRSKQEALLEVCLLALDDYVRRMEVIAAGSQPFEAKLLATVNAHLLRYREKDEAFKVYNDERLYLPEATREPLKARGSHYRRLLEQMFEKAIADGAVRDDVDCHFGALSVIGICNAMGDLIVRDEKLDLIELTQNCIDLLLNGFSASSAAHQEGNE